MDFWEQAVANYLALDQGLFINPQYLVGVPGTWEAYADFLAIEFPENAVWMTEVTQRPGDSLFRKIKGFEADYLPRIKEQLISHRIIRDGNLEEWSVGFWVFARREQLPQLETLMGNAGVQKFRLTALEDTP